jgi:hypothetical protein
MTMDQYGGLFPDDKGDQAAEGERALRAITVRRSSWQRNATCDGRAAAMAALAGVIARLFRIA